MSIDNDESIEEQSKFFGEALKCFDKALEIDPKYTYAWVSKGLAFFNKKDYDQALVCYDKALEIDPKYTDAWNSKGNLFYDKKDYDQALGSILASICAVPSSFQKKTYVFLDIAPATKRRCSSDCILSYIAVK